MIREGGKDIVDVPGFSKVYSGADLVWPAYYLDISPEIVWLTPWAENDVYSNTSWNIE